MKRLSQILTMAILAVAFMTISVFAETIKEVTISSNPHCNNCKTKIESGLKKIDGVKSSVVDVDKKTVLVKYDSDKINEESVRKSIADMGYKADNMKAKDKECTDKKGKKNKNCCKTTGKECKKD